MNARKNPATNFRAMDPREPRSGLVFKSRELPYSTFDDWTMESCNFAQSNLQRSTFVRAQIKDTHFNGADLTGSMFSAARIHQSHFRKIGTSGCLDRICLDDAVLDKVNMKDATAWHAWASRAQFNHCNLKEASFKYAQLSDARFSDCNMGDFSANDSNLQRSVFTACNLKDASFDDADLEHAAFQNAHLPGATFLSARISHANFEGANMHRARATQAVGVGVNLRNTDLQYSQLDKAIFCDADLTGANLTHAHLSNTNLARAKLGGACLEHVTYNENTQWPDGFEPPVSAICMDAYGRATRAAEDIFNRNGMRRRYEDRKATMAGVFVDGPSDSELWDIIYCMYPELFTVVERWAYPEASAVAIYETILLGLSNVRKGDGTSPYNTELEKTTCLMQHFYGLFTHTQVCALGDIYTGKEIKKGNALLEDSRVVQMYMRLSEAVTAARTAHARATSKEAKKKALTDLPDSASKADHGDTVTTPTSTPTTTEHQAG